jgi:hypothetical protein
MTASTGIALGSILASASILGALELKSRDNVVTAGFWFDDDVTFEVHDPRRLGGPLTVDEEQRIVTIARGEIGAAFSTLRIRVIDNRHAFYRVGVQQMIRPPGRNSFARGSGAAGLSHVFGPLGGAGSVNFYMLAAQAIAFAPTDAARADIVDAIGRGIGRAAVHEFAHQILPHGPMHTSDDEASYEYWTSNRRQQYYGPMHWSVAYPTLQQRLAR